MNLTNIYWAHTTCVQATRLDIGSKDCKKDLVSALKKTEGLVGEIDKQTAKAQWLVVVWWKKTWVHWGGSQRIAEGRGGM